MNITLVYEGKQHRGFQAKELIQGYFSQLFVGELLQCRWCNKTLPYVLRLGPAMFCHLLVVVMNVPGRKKVYIVCLT